MKLDAEALVPTMQAAETKQTSAAAAASSTASRFAYNELVEEETQKAPNVRRGKDGHLRLGSGQDFFSNPLGEAGGTSPMAGPARGSRSDSGTSSHDAPQACDNGAGHVSRDGPDPHYVLMGQTGGAEKLYWLVHLRSGPGPKHKQPELNNVVS